MKHGPKHRRRQNCRARIDSSLSIPEQQLSVAGRFKNNATGTTCRFAGDVTPGSTGSIESITSIGRECVITLKTQAVGTIRKLKHYATKCGFRLSGESFDGIRTAWTLKGAGDTELRDLTTALSADSRTRNRWTIEFRSVARNGTGTDLHKATRLSTIALTRDIDSKAACQHTGQDDENAKRRDYSAKPGEGSCEPTVDGRPTANEYDHTDSRVGKIGKRGQRLPMVDVFHEDRHSEST